MLDHAVWLAANGSYVFVVGATAKHAEVLRASVAARVVGATLAGTKVYVPSQGGQISFESGESRQFDWQNLRMIGSHPNCVVLVDHFAIECRWGNLLREFTRWDSP
jgi:hypothetical protein